MSNHEIESSFSPAGPEIHWKKLFDELCYEVFYKNPTGKMLLSHLENKHFRSPVAYPNRDASWAYFNEGQNEIIRSFSLAIQSHINRTDK